MKQHIIKKALKMDEIPNSFSLKPLDGDSLNIFYVDTIKERTADPFGSPMEDIFEACMKPSEDNIFLLMGHIGCGKSTELNKLATRFREKGFLVKIINCLDDLGNSPIYTDLLILVGEALFQMAAELGCSFDTQLGKLILEFWNTEIVKNTVQIEDYAIDINAGAEIGTSFFDKIFKAFAKIKAGIKLQQTDSKEYKMKIEKRSGNWYSAIGEISDLITDELDGKQPILIFEDLDKLDRYNTDLVWDMFSLHADNLCSFTFPVIYTFPISLSYSLQYNRLIGYYKEKILPMIELKKYDGSPCEDSVAVIKKIVLDRMASSLIDEEMLSLIIAKTGGCLRDLFVVICDSSIRANRRESGKIERVDVMKALNSLKTSLARRIEIKDYDFLYNIIHRYKQNIEDREKLLKMLTGNIVLEYNSKRWQDVHPLIVDFLQETKNELPHEMCKL